MEDIKEVHKQHVAKAMAAADTQEARLRAFFAGQHAALRAMLKKAEDEIVFQEKHIDDIVAGVFSGVSASDLK
jgi:hypothetical protein